MSEIASIGVDWGERERKGEVEMNDELDISGTFKKVFYCWIKMMVSGVVMVCLLFTITSYNRCPPEWFQSGWTKGTIVLLVLSLIWYVLVCRRKGLRLLNEIESSLIMRAKKKEGQTATREGLSE